MIRSGQRQVGALPARPFAFSVPMVVLALVAAGLALPVAAPLPHPRPAWHQGRVTTGRDSAAPEAMLMPDGRRWTTTNLAVQTASSYCYEDAATNCRTYGRLYTWHAAHQACRTLGAGWRLPAEADWQRMAKPFGGVRDDSTDGGKAAYRALMTGGRSGVDLVLGGGRNPDGRYARLDAHGFYWTATEAGPDHAWFYNVGKGGQILNRHAEGEKGSAFAVRCVRD